MPVVRLALACQRATSEFSNSLLSHFASARSSKALPFIACALGVVYNMNHIHRESKERVLFWDFLSTCAASFAFCCRTSRTYRTCNAQTKPCHPKPRLLTLRVRGASCDSAFARARRSMSQSSRPLEGVVYLLSLYLLNTTECCLLI